MATVRNLLEARELELRLIQAGALDAQVAWVAEGSTAEVIEHASAGALVMLHDTASPRDTVAALSRQRAAAIVWRGPLPLPTEMTQAAGDYRVTLIEAPQTTAPAAIARVVAGLRHRDDLGQAREALLAQRQVLDLAHSDSHPAAIISAVAQLTNRQVALVDREGRAIAATQGFSVGAEEQQRLLVGSGRELVATGPTLSPEGAAAFTSAAIVLSIDDRTRAHNSVIERERWGRVTRAVVTGEADARPLAHVLDPTLELPHRVRVLVVQGPAEEIAEWRAEEREGALRLITRYPVETGRSTATSAGVVVAWQVVSQETLESALQSAAGWGLDVAIGIETDLAQAPVSRRSAEALLPRLSTVEQLYRAPRIPRVLHADEAGALMQLLFAHEQGALAGATLLGPLSAGHPDFDLSLRETLQAFLTHHGQRGPAAEQLAIHRNTLRSRLERIERLTGFSLDSADDRAQLWLALRLEG